jgi:hypothetical protein
LQVLKKLVWLQRRDFFLPDDVNPESYGLFMVIGFSMLMTINKKESARGYVYQWLAITAGFSWLYR